MKYYSWELDRSNIHKYVGSISQIGGIDQYEYVDGKAKGVRVSSVNTGSGLNYKVLVDRGMDIDECTFNGKPISWLSKTGVVHPSYYNQFEDEKLRTFHGGLLTTCGLTNVGPSSRDEGLHGRISDTPAEKYSYNTFWKDDQYELVQSGEVTQSKIFNENLTMKREIKSYLGENKIFINTDVVNNGLKKVPLMYLMHMNFGFPLLSEKTELIINYDHIIPRDEVAKMGLKRFFEFQEPTLNFNEEVYFVDVTTDEFGFAEVYLYNNSIGKKFGVKIRYKKAELSHLTIWKILGGQGEYALGIEPGNCNPIGKVAAEKNKVLKFINPGETKSFNVELEFSDEKFKVEEVKI